MRALFLLLVFLAAPAAVLADHPRPWQLDFQDAASPRMEYLYDFHNLLLVITSIITLFVLCLLVYVCLRYSARRNPTPSKTSHNTLIEIVWTAVPALILVFIFIPSYRLLGYLDHVENAEMTLKVTGLQWYWNYQYPDHGGFSFDSYMIPDKDIKEGQIRLLEVDNRVVLPVDTTVRVQITAADVLHAWSVSSLGVKMDAVPGRLNETWVRIDKPGVYYGQCSELCGQGHGFMPIVIQAVPQEVFAEWVEKAKAQFAEEKYSEKTNNQLAAIVNTQPTSSAP